MSTAHLIDPELVGVLELLPTIDLSVDALPTLRSAILEMNPVRPLPEGAERLERFAPALNGAPDVRLIVHLPAVRRTQTPILHIHGGGMVMGKPDMNDTRNAALADKLGCVIVSADYRLAPETIAPGNVEDCQAVLRWISAHADELGGINADQTILLGESAGGGLAAALALLERDQGRNSIALLTLIYPMLDDRSGFDTDATACGEFIWTRESNIFGWNCLTGGAAGTDAVSHYAAPARAASLAGLPPTYIAVGALDLFIEENLSFAARLAKGGVPVELHVYPGAFHAFDLAADARVSRRFANDLEEALVRAMR